jgi:hypothetical protein
MSLHVLAYNLKRTITIFGVGPLIRGDQNLIARDQAARANRSNRRLDRHSRETQRAPTPYDTFFHGLGHGPSYAVDRNERPLWVPQASTAPVL